MSAHKRIFITPGEPAGIGPDIVLQIAQEQWAAELVVLADASLLEERATQLGLSIKLIDWQVDQTTTHQPGTLKIFPIKLATQSIPGQLNPANANYVLQTLTHAASFCQQHATSALVTGPVHKGVINQAGYHFSGHTEFFANLCKVKQTIMLFVVDQFKVALATTHLPLKNVPQAITRDGLKILLSLLNAELKKYFRIEKPQIYVCGLNPHAGEEGYLGREEIEVITPALDELRQQGLKLFGPLSADTIFTPKFLEKADAILAMYHDQALPIVKHIGFGHAVNVTLGLPFIRTSVDHGTAVDIAGSGKADAGSMRAAMELAIAML